MILAVIFSFVIAIIIFSGHISFPNYIAYPLLFLIIVWWISLLMNA